MKRAINILLILFFCMESSKSQDCRLTDSRHLPDGTKDCKRIGNCISDKYFKNDTLFLTIFADINCRDLSKLRDTISYYHDTLSLNFIDTTGTKSYLISFNASKNKLDTFISVIRIERGCLGGYDCQRNEYKLTGFKEIPRVFQFEHETLCDCPIKSISFEFYKGDTINLVNLNGQKHGLWLRFFDSGEVMEKKIYKNGRFIEGTNYDKAGNDLHWISDGNDAFFELRK